VDKSRNEEIRKELEILGNAPSPWTDHIDQFSQGTVI
jgi:hypothetical protein